MPKTKKSELDQWKQAAADSLHTIRRLEGRLDKLKAVNRALRTRVRDLEAPR